MQMKHAERRQNILCHFLWWVRFSVSRDEPERERTSSMRWRSILAARAPISRPKFQKKAKKTIAVRQNKQTLIETVIKFCM